MNFTDAYETARSSINKKYFCPKSCDLEDLTKNAQFPFYFFKQLPYN